MDNRQSLSWSCFCTLAIMTSSEGYFHRWWFNLRREARVYAAAEPLSTTMSYSHACPCPVTHPSPRVLPCPALVPFTRYHLLLTCLSPTVTVLTHAFTCMSFSPRTSWIINNWYCGTNSLRRFVCPSRSAWLTQSHPHKGPHTSSLRAPSRRPSLQQLYLDASFDHPCLLP